jgi:hypothetical protein
METKSIGMERNKDRSESAKTEKILINVFITIRKSKSDSLPCGFRVWKDKQWRKGGIIAPKALLFLKLGC